MRKAIVITDDTKYSQLVRYDGYPFLVISKNHPGLESDKRFSDFAKRTSYVGVDPSQYLEEENIANNEPNIDKVIEYLYKKGFDEIVILSDIKTSATNFLEYLLVLKKYHYLHISYENEFETIQYFEVGSHVINKETSISISLIPLVEASVSLDYTIDKINHVKIDAQSGPLKDIKLFQRLALLTVEQGAILLIRKLGENHEN